MFFFQLIRLPNLLIIIFTQWLIYQGLFLPALTRNDIPSLLDGPDFLWMIGLTLLIAIPGYIINDLADVHTDWINKGRARVIGEKLSVKNGKILYICLVSIGLLLSVVYAIVRESVPLLYLYPLYVAMLAFYSSHLKGIVLLGNTVIALFSASVPAIVYLFDRHAMQALRQANDSEYAQITSIMLAFCVFAFLSSLYREIVKDMEDVAGDRSMGLKTIAVKWGTSASRWMALVIATLLIAALALWTINPLNRMQLILIIYPLGLILFTGHSIYVLLGARKKDQFHRVSQQIKVLMFLGLLYLILYMVFL